MGNTNSDVPQQEAFQLCAEVRQQYQGKWWTIAGMQCTGCNAAARGDMSKRCVSSGPGYRGCNLVNARYDRELVVRTGGTS